MMESRFVCKLCNKKYPCGKSLGGHMRSHVVAISAESDDKFEVMMKDSKLAESGNGLSAYGLRENPKKTWRAVDSRAPSPQDNICKQCGKGFQSLKALCGHMACHSEKDRGFKDDYSWTSESGKMVLDSHSDTEAEETRMTRSSSKSTRYKKVVDNSPFALANNNGSSSVTEIDRLVGQEEVAMCLMMLSKDSGYNKGGGVNSVVESSDNNSVVLETKSSSIEMMIGKKESVNYIPQMKKIGCRKSNGSDLGDEIAETENSDSGYFLDECAKAESDVSVDGFRRYSGFGECKSLKVIKNSRTELSKKIEYDDDDDDDNGIMASNSVARTESRKRKYGSENPESLNESVKTTKNGSSKAEFNNNSQKKSKYECFNCKKVFKSYQALGGHRPCHKRSNDFQENNSVYESSGYSKKSSGKKLSYGAEKKNKANKSKPHICPFCDRVFKNGQALGGHKRSHFIGVHDENYNQSPVEKPDEHTDLLDLNLPAPEADEDYERSEFFSW